MNFKVKDCRNNKEHIVKADDWIDAIGAASLVCGIEEDSFHNSRHTSETHVITQDCECNLLMEITLEEQNM